MLVSVAHFWRFNGAEERQLNPEGPIHITFFGFSQKEIVVERRLQAVIGWERCVFTHWQNKAINTY